MKLAKLKNEPEIFYTIQGEGKNLGKPSIFIRLSLCNLYCKWCDTDYTWNWKNTDFKHQNDKKYSKLDHIIDLSNKEIVEELNKYRCQNIVITGGEPLLQDKAVENLVTYLNNPPMVGQAQKSAYFIEIETNGTIIPSSITHQFVNQYNVSIKLENSGVAKKHRIKPKAIEFFAQTAKSNFKFVVNSPEDLKEIQTLISKYQISSKTVYLMPQGIDSKTLQEKQQWLVEICKMNGYNYTDRLHIHLYGDKRGV